MQEGVGVWGQEITETATSGHVIRILWIKTNVFFSVVAEKVSHKRFSNYIYYKNYKSHLFILKVVLIFFYKRTNDATSTKPHAAIAFTMRTICSHIYLCIGPAGSNVELLNQFLSWNLHFFCLLYQYSKI